jgi:hypothetical protein
VRDWFEEAQVPGNCDDHLMIQLAVKNALSHQNAIAHDQLRVPWQKVMYHYCRSEPFLGIMRIRSIWASAFYTVNDTTERRWGYSMFEKPLKAMEPEVDPDFIKKVVQPVIVGDANTVLTLACFSLDADVLSPQGARGQVVQ